MIFFSWQDNHTCQVSLDMYFVKLTGPGGGEIDVDNDLTKSVFRVVNNGRHKIHFSISTIFLKTHRKNPLRQGGMYILKVGIKLDLNRKMKVQLVK